MYWKQDQDREKGDISIQIGITSKLEETNSTCEDIFEIRSFSDH